MSIKKLGFTEKSDPCHTLLKNLAHEMRTPLTVLLGNARLLQHSLSDEDKKRIIDNIIAEIHRLENMDQQLLKLTTLQNEKLEIKQISVLKILREAAERLKWQADGIHIIVEGTNSVIYGNQDLISIMLDNLIANAIQASSSGMIVTLKALPTGFSIQDTGIGMSIDVLQHACEPFWKADSARTRNKSGVGLGLSICHHIAEKHNGKLTLDSKIGRGTTAIFTMPVL